MPDIDAPFVPMSKGEPRQHAYFYGVFLGRFPGTPVAFFIMALWIDIGNKSDLFAVGRNYKGSLNPGRSLRDLLDASPVRSGDINLRRPVAVGDKYNGFSIRC